MRTLTNRRWNENDKPTDGVVQLLLLKVSHASLEWQQPKLYEQHI